MTKSQSDKVAIIALAACVCFILIGCAPDYNPPSPSAANASSVDTATTPLYRAYKIFSAQTTATPPVTTTNPDYFISTDQYTSLPSGYTSLGAYMSVLTNTSSTRVQLFSCSATYQATSTLVHYVSVDSACEGGDVLGPLGYLERNPVGPVIIPVRRCAATAADISGVSGNMGGLSNDLITTSQTECLPNYAQPILGYTL